MNNSASAPSTNLLIIGHGLGQDLEMSLVQRFYYCPYFGVYQIHYYQSQHYRYPGDRQTYGHRYIRDHQIYGHRRGGNNNRV